MEKNQISRSRNKFRTRKATYPRTARESKETGRRGEKEVHAHTYAMLMVAWLHVYRGNVRARACTYITFIHRYCRLPRTRSAEQILEARLPRCHCGKCWSLSTRRAQEVDADQRWCREKRKRFFGRIIAGETTTRCKIIALLLRKYQASNNQSVFFFQFQDSWGLLER